MTPPQLLHESSSSIPKGRCCGFKDTIVSLLYRGRSLIVSCGARYKSDISSVSRRGYLIVMARGVFQQAGKNGA
jgi:hypothetical protein